MEEKIKQDLKTAMLSRDETRVSTLRLLISELTYAKVAKQTEELSDEDVISAVQKEAKKRKESIESFTKGNRPELAAKEEAELKILEEYLPAQMSDEELTKLVEEAITETGASSMADMGKVIGMVMSKAGQSVEGARVSSLVKQKLSS